MKKYTTAMGQHCTYLRNDLGFYVARSLGTTKEDNDQLNTLAADLNELALLRESHKELMECAKLWRTAAFTSERAEARAKTRDALARAESLIGSPKPHGGEPQAKEERKESAYEKAIRTNVKPAIWPPITMSQSELDHFRTTGGLL